MDVSLFLIIMPCSLMKVNQHLGGTFHFHHQGQKQETNMERAASMLFFCGLFNHAFSVESL
jgi:hypothetical protein